MTILDFYNGAMTPEGHTFDLFLNYSRDELEGHHNFIQWVFPTTLPSAFNDAPILTEEEIKKFNDSYHLKVKLLTAFEKMLDFYDFELNEGKINALDNEPWVLESFNHNHLRITRILHSLTLLGFRELAVEFLNSLKEFDYKISEDTLEYWEIAVQE